MHKVFSAFFCIIVLIITGCAGTTPITNYSERIKGPGYSALPPQEEGWSIWRKARGGLILGKEGRNIDETIIAMIIMFQLPEVSSDEEFLDVIERAQSQDLPTGRYKVLTSSNELMKKRQWSCVESSYEAEDHGARKKSKNTAHMIQQFYGFYCRHPYDKEIGVNFGYSHRYYQGNQDQQFFDKAKHFADNVVLEDF